MTIYLFVLSMLISSVLLFSSETGQSRIVTIQRPIVITQERKTPAYFVYQQVQLLQQKKPETSLLPTTYLSRESLSESEVKIEIAEMKFSKKEFLLNRSEPDYYTASYIPKVNAEIKSLTYGNADPSEQLEIPLNQQVIQAQELSPVKKWATIRGKFELIEGVGIVDHYIEIKRVEEGQVREVGHIDLKAGLYTIDIESPQGDLIAQIKDRNGGLIGEDREKLINLQSRGTFFEGPFMRVGQPGSIAANPTPNNSYAANGKSSALNNKTRSASAATQGFSVSLFDNQNKLSSPGDAFANISKYSSTISRVFDPSRIYKNTTSIRQTGEKTETSMFTSKWIEGVTAYISDIQKIEFKSKTGPIIIGRVLVDGKPVRDAQIQIESAPGTMPIYLDQFMIPSVSLQATSDNGYFMFVGLEPDNYILVATKQNIILGSQIFIAEEDSIAFQNITSISIPRNKVIRTFDAFAGTPMDVDIVSAETDEARQTVSGATVYKSYTESGIGEFLARTNDNLYLPVRYIQNLRQDYAHIPMIKETWLEAIKNSRKIIEKANTGIIIGFTSDLNYDAYLVSDGYNISDIVYFNSAGQVVPEPENGGGFILYNVPIGAREVVLQEKNSERIYSQVFNIIVQQVSVAHFLGD